ncbi:hypothetical protein ACI65C_000704 [Semiaphis heraclei]
MFPSSVTSQRPQPTKCDYGVRDVMRAGRRKHDASPARPPARPPTGVPSQSADRVSVFVLFQSFTVHTPSSQHTRRRHIHIYSRYDNEYGYSNRVVDLIKYMQSKD